MGNGYRDKSTDFQKIEREHTRFSTLIRNLQEADRALYAAKEAGRDCVIHAADLTGE